MIMATNNVLFVDDDENMLKSIKRSLKNESYNKYYAISGLDAIEIVKTVDIHVIVTDMRMPQMDGLNLLVKIKDINPNIIKIVLSGYTQMPQILATINKVDLFKFVGKPWESQSEFKTIINDAIEKYNIENNEKENSLSVSKKNEVYQKMLKAYDGKLTNLKDDKDEVFRIQDKVNEILIDFIQKNENSSMDAKQFSEILLSINECNKMVKRAYPSTKKTLSANLILNKVMEGFLEQCQTKMEYLNNYVSDNKENHVVEVNIRLISVLVNILVSFIFVPVDRCCSIDFKIGDECIYDKGTFLMLNFELHSIEYIDERNKLLIEFYIEVLQNIIKLFNGTLNFSFSDTQKTIKFTVLGKIVE